MYVARRAQGTTATEALGSAATNPAVDALHAVADCAQGVSPGRRGEAFAAVPTGAPPTGRRHNPTLSPSARPATLRHVPVTPLQCPTPRRATHRTAESRRQQPARRPPQRPFPTVIPLGPGMLRAPARSFRTAAFIRQESEESAVMACRPVSSDRTTRGAVKAWRPVRFCSRPPRAPDRRQAGWSPQRRLQRPRALPPSSALARRCCCGSCGGGLCGRR